MFVKIARKPLVRLGYCALSVLWGGLLVTGCGRFEVTARVEPLQEPAVTAVSSPTPVPATVVPPEEPTAIPTLVVPTATPISSPTPIGAQAMVDNNGSAPLFLDATYRDSVAGIALDYPSHWTITELSDEQKAQAIGYSTTFQSWPARPGGGGGIPDAGTKIDLAVNRTGAMSLAEVSAYFRQQIQEPDKVLAEEPIVLSSGLQGLRFRTSSIFGEAEQTLFLVNGYVVIFNGLGDEAVIRQILQTLRVTG